MSEKDDYINYFRMVWNQNKTRGLKAQTYFENEMENGVFKKHSDKLFNGCWLISPKSFESHKTRFCVFVHNKIEKDLTPEIDPKTILSEKWRPFHAIAEFMDNAGFGVIYAIPSTKSGKIDFNSIMKKDYSSIEWNLYFYQNEKLEKEDGNDFFEQWKGRGRPTYRKDSWNDPNLENELKQLSIEKLESMILQELFYTGYIKSIHKKVVADPYDVDSFIISLSQKHIFPVEMKEKFPVLKSNERYFGLDAGRILMLFRICIANDSNALYIVRQVAENGRKLEGWKFITLSKIIMSAGWNLQAGGLGMVGGATQTVKLPYDEFEDLTEQTLEEENLKKISNLPADVKSMVKEYGNYLAKNFY